MGSLAFVVLAVCVCGTLVLDPLQLAQAQGALLTASEPYFFTEEDLDAGLHLSWQRLGNTTQSLNLTGVHLPEDLKQSYEFYNTVTVRHNGLYMYRSVNGGVLVVHFDSDLAYLNHQVITWPDTGRLPCQPTAVFRGATDFFLFTACLNRTEDRLWFVHVQIDSSNITTWTLDPTTDVHKSVSFENLTAFIRSDKAYSCPSLDSQHYVLFISGRVVYAYLSFAKVVEARGHLSENCSEPVRLEFLETEKPGRVLVHCKGHYSEVINSCNDLFVAGYENTLVPCSSELTVYFNSSGVLISRPNDNLTSFIAVDIGPESTRGSVCITADHSTFLMLVLSNSTLVLVDVVSQEVYRLGTSCTDSDWCPIPQVSRNRYLVYPNITHLLVTDINCLSQPVLVNNGIPEVFYLYLPSQDLPPIPKCNEVSSTIPRKEDGSTDKTAMIVGIVAAVVTIAIVVVVAAAVVVCIFRGWRPRTKYKEDLREVLELPSPGIESPLPQIPSRQPPVGMADENDCAVGQGPPVTRPAEISDAERNCDQEPLNNSQNGPTSAGELEATSEDSESTHQSTCVGRNTRNDSQEELVSSAAQVGTADTDDRGVEQGSLPAETTFGPDFENNHAQEPNSQNEPTSAGDTELEGTSEDSEFTQRFTGVGRSNSREELFSSAAGRSDSQEQLATVQNIAQPSSDRPGTTAQLVPGMSSAPSHLFAQDPHSSTPSSRP